MVILVYKVVEPSYPENDEWIENLELSYKEFQELADLEELINFIRKKAKLKDYLVVTILNILRIGD